jgi:hypothetical protein
MTFTKKTITIRADQEARLKEYPEINLSGQVQKWLDKLFDALDGR